MQHIAYCVLRWHRYVGTSIDNITFATCEYRLEKIQYNKNEKSLVNLVYHEIEL